MTGRPSTAASRSASSSGPITAAVRSSSPAGPSSSHRADTDSTSDAGSSAPAACWASSVRNSGCPFDRAYSSSTRPGPDQLGRRVPAERVEVDERRRGQRLSLAGPDRGDDRRRDVLAPGEPQPVRQRRAGQVRVVDDDHERRALRQAAEQPDQGRVQHRRAEHAVGQHRRRPFEPRARRHVQQRRQQRRVGAEDVGAHPGLELAQPGGQRGQQRVERQRAVERPARRHQHRVPGRRAPVGPGAQQRRLPDAGLAVDDGHLGGAAAGPRRDRLEAGQLVVPADQARAAPGPAARAPSARRAGSRCRARSSRARDRCPARRPSGRVRWRRRPAPRPPGRPSRRRGAGRAGPPRRTGRVRRPPRRRRRPPSSRRPRAAPSPPPAGPGRSAAPARPAGAGPTRRAAAAGRRRGSARARPGRPPPRPSRGPLPAAPPPRG